jgi:hypothetical protein
MPLPSPVLSRSAVGKSDKQVPHPWITPKPAIHAATSPAVQMPAGVKELADHFALSVDRGGGVHCTSPSIGILIDGIRQTILYSISVYTRVVFDRIIRNSRVANETLSLLDLHITKLINVLHGCGGHTGASATEIY